MFLLYSLLFSVGVVLTAPYYLWRLRGNILSVADWRQRLGTVPAEIASPGNPVDERIWVHAVSVGETLAVAGLVQKLQSERPSCQIFLSSVTIAGRETGAKRLTNISGRFLLPLDWRWTARRALLRVQPSLLLLVETELWPNLLRAARENGTRVAVVNARLSDRSFRGYRLVKLLMRKVLEGVDLIAAQTPQDAERFIALGAKPERVIVTGNLKFDAKPPEVNQITRILHSAASSAERAPVLVAASTMPGEEEILLRAWKLMRGQHARALLILAPRHANRFDEVCALLGRLHCEYVRRSQLSSDMSAVAEQIRNKEILLIDTIGELAGIFEIADLAFVGGSLVATGGHNLLEPAYWGKPVLFGPHMENFRDIARQFVSASAAAEVKDADGLASAVLDLLHDPGRCAKMGAAAKQLLQEGSGATERTLARLRVLLSAGLTKRSDREYIT